jgi:DNA-binding response OmpR family regulator
VSTTERPLIYVLDDDEATCELLETFCELEGYRVRGFARGIDLLVAAAKAPPNVVLLDVLIGDVDGFRLCRALKNNPPTAHVPVLLMSGLVRPVDYQTAVRMGADAYLAKPLDLDTLADLLALHVTFHESRTPEPTTEDRGCRAPHGDLVS